MSRSPRPECEPFRDDLGASVLGGLDEDGQHALEQHLRSCEACRAEHQELAGLPALLELAREPAPLVPARVRDRVVAAAARRQSRRRWVAATVAAAVLAALVGAAIGLRFAPEPAAPIAVPLDNVEPFEDAAGWATIRSEPDRLVVALDVRGLAELPDPEVYEAWLYTHDERIVSIGQLDVADGRASVELVAEGDLADYSGFWITAEPDRRDPAHEGETVLRAPLPDRL